MDGGLLTLLCQEDCFLIPICAAVSSLRLQRATQLSTPGLPLDRFSLWTTCMGSGTSVHGSGHSGNPEGNHTRGLEFPWGSLRLAVSLKEGLSSCQGVNILPPSPNLLCAFRPVWYLSPLIVILPWRCFSQLSNFSLVPHFELSRPCIFCCGLLTPRH